MNIKQFVIKVCDITCYILLALVCIIAFLTGLVNPLHGAIVGIVGLVLFAFVTGYWFVLSSVADSNSKQVELLNRQNALIEKLNRSLEAHNYNQFPNE